MNNAYNNFYLNDDLWYEIGMWLNGGIHLRDILNFALINRQTLHVAHMHHFYHCPLLLGDNDYKKDRFIGTIYHEGKDNEKYIFTKKNYLYFISLNNTDNKENKNITNMVIINDDEEPPLKKKKQPFSSSSNYYCHVVVERKYQLNARKALKGTWGKDGKKEGLWREWNENGGKTFEATYVNGKKEELQNIWWPNGQKAYEATWKNGKREGLSQHWHENGELEKSK